MSETTVMTGTDPVMIVAAMAIGVLAGWLACEIRIYAKGRTRGGKGGRRW